MTRSAKLLLLLGTLVLGLQSNAPAQQADAQSLGTLRPNFTNRPTVIAIAPFASQGAGIDRETIPRIIRNDLELNGFFKNLPDQTAVNRLNMRDGGANPLWEEWAKLGVEHYVVGNAREEGGNIVVQIMVHDIKSRRTIMNREFRERTERVRFLGHTISDVVTNFIKGEQGFARTRIVYVTEQVPGTHEIAVMDSDGFNRRNLTNFSKVVTGPSWGPNGTEIYFTSWHTGRANIYGMQLIPDAALNLNPGQMWPIAAHGGSNLVPSWSNAAGRLTLILSKDGNPEIYTALRDGKDLRRVTQTKFVEGSPTWSPDGRQIAFTSDEAGGVHVFLINADGSNKRRLTTRGRWNDAAAWSPDGNRIVFVSREGGVNDIFLVDLSGRNYQRLTMNQGNNTSPAWSPGGRHIIFTSTRTGQEQIFIMMDDGSNQRQLTNSGKNRKGSWGPLPPER